jgi:hypothetical protein
MNMKELNSDGVEVFEGHEVSAYDGKFSGTFELEHETGVSMAHDDLISFVVTARVTDAKFATSKTTGIQKRTNTLAIEEVIALDPDRAQWLYDQLGKIVVGVNSLNEGQLASVPQGEFKWT